MFWWGWCSLYHFLYFRIRICVVCVRRQESLNFAWESNKWENCEDDDDEDDDVDDDDDEDDDDDDDDDDDEDVGDDVDDDDDEDGV